MTSNKRRARSAGAQRGRVDPPPSVRWRPAIVLSAVAALLAIAEIVWIAVFVGRWSDGPAFAMALVAAMAIPTLLAAGVVSIVPRIRRRVRIMVPAAVAAAGFVAAGFQAGVFVGDDPTDPEWIKVVATLPLLGVLVAAVLLGLVAWDLSRPLSVIARIPIALAVALVGPLVLGFLLLTAVPAIVLLAIVAPFGFVGGALLASRRRVGA